MNSAEKHLVLLALILFVLGFFLRWSPWNLPEIGSVPVEFKQYEEKELNSTPTSISESLKQREKTANAEISSKEKPKRKSRDKSKSKPKIQFPVAINSASSEVLCAIPGVGPKMAEKIIAFRNLHGPLKTESDLQKISGIGKKKSKIILKNIKFD